MIDASRFSYLRGAGNSWTEEQVRDIWSEALNNPISPTNSHNNLYIHVPFCKSICTFCNYERLKPSTSELLEEYIVRFEESVNTFGPVFKDLPFHALYVGGGTPSILPPKLLQRMMEAVHDSFQFVPHPGKHFEFDPAVMSMEKTEVLKSFGFEHFSFGIQTLDADVNEAHNRGPQDREMVSKRFKQFYENGMHDVSCDILLGLAGTTAAGLEAELIELLETNTPRRVDIFSLTPTHSYVDRHFGGSFDAFWEHLKPFQEELIPRLPNLAKSAGYTWFDGSGHHMMMERGPSLVTPEMNTKSLHSYNALSIETKRPIHILGLGRSARSQIFGYAAFQARDPEGAGADPNGPAEYVGHHIDREIEIRTYLAHYLRDTDKIDREVFRRIFGIDITEAIPRAIAAWDDDGLLKGVSEEFLELQPQDRTARTLSLMWIIPDEYMEFEVGRRDGLDLRAENMGMYVFPLTPGSRVGGHFVLERFEQARVVLKSDSGAEIILRIAPECRANGGGDVKIVLESRPPTDPAELSALKKVVPSLRKIVEHHRIESMNRRPNEEDRERERAPAYSTQITPADSIG
jgi:coproporphyrinogen III oxidase-like Fe-S oxidoreductase